MPTSSLQDTIASIGFAKVIVSLKGAPSGAAAASVQTKNSIENYFMIPNLAQAESLAASASRAASRNFRRAEPPTARRVRVYPNLGLALGYVNAGGLASLEADQQVRKVEKAPELSLIRPVVVEAAKLGVGPTWGIKRMKADQLWAAGFTGKGVLVGHLDTGVDGTHPALAGAIGRFAEFDMTGERVPNAKPTDSDEHGTHTAGTIVGRSGLKGKFGVAPGAQLASAMVIENGDVIARILAGMDWVIGEGVRVMSMSLGLRGFTPAFQTIVDALRAANVLPVIAVGNEGADTSRSPGNYANVLSIGAMDSSDRVADFSGSQQFDRPVNPLCPGLVAPGVDVLSCVPNGKFKTMDGSSMATPHVAGLAALLLEANPSASANDLERAIVGSCTLPGSMLQARGSHGVPDAVRAFQLLTGTQLPAAAAAAPPSRRVPKRNVRKAPARRVAARTVKKPRPKGKRPPQPPNERDRDAALAPRNLAKACYKVQPWLTAELCMPICGVRATKVGAARERQDQDFPQWESKAVAKRLSETTSAGRPSSVQVFLNDEVSANDIPEKAKEIVKDMSESLNLPADAIKIGKVFRSAKSFSLSTDVPDVFDAIASRVEVKTILDSTQPDILPKPKNVKEEL